MIKKKLKFGLSFLPDSKEPNKSASEYYKEVFSLSNIADQAGLSIIKMTEHYGNQYGGYCPSPLIFLAAIAKATKQIRLMTGCLLPAFHHPIQLAAEIALLDVISNGRVDIGFARAHLPQEFDAFGINLDESRNRYQLTIKAIEKLWQEKNTSMKTEYFSFENFSNMPETIQKPHPPIWGAAVNSRESFAWLGENHYNLLITPPILQEIEYMLDYVSLYRSCIDYSLNKQHAMIAMSMPIIINNDANKAIQDSEKILHDYMHVWADASREWDYRKSSAYPKYANLSKFLRSNTPELMRKQHQALVGDPDYIIDSIHKIQDMFDLDYLLLQIDTGSQDYFISHKTLDLFINKVMPNL